MFLAPISVSVDNFPVRMRGTIIGLTGSFNMVGAAVFGSIYAGLFTERPLGNYFLLLATVSIVANLLSMCILKPIPLVSDDVHEEENMRDIRNDSLFNNDNNPADSWHVGFGISLLKIPALHILSWCHILSAVPDVTICINITTMATSFGHNGLVVSLPIQGPICALLTTLVVGFISDRTLKYVSRLSYVLIANLLELFFFIFATFYGDDPHILSGLVLSTYIHSGFNSVIVPTLVTEYFGSDYFMRIWGAILLAGALLTMVLNVIIGAWYDNAITNGGTACYGLACFQRTFILSGAMCTVAILLNGILWYLERKKTRQYERVWMKKSLQIQPCFVICSRFSTVNIENLCCYDEKNVVCMYAWLRLQLNNIAPTQAITLNKHLCTIVLNLFYCYI